MGGSRGAQATYYILLNPRAVRKGLKYFFVVSYCFPMLQSLACAAMQRNSVPNGRAFLWLFWLSLLFITFLLAGNLAAYLRYGTFAFESGEYYYNRLLSMSMAKAFQTYGINFYDPFSRQEPIFYQFVSYWALGWLAGLLRIEPWTLANVLQLFVPPALFAVIYHLAKFLTGSRAAALAATLLAFLFGSLEFLFTGTDRIIFYGNHAIVLDLLRQLSTFYMDNVGLLLGYFTLFCFLKAGMDERPATRRRWSAAMLLAAAVAFNVHLLTAILILTICAWCWPPARSPRETYRSVGWSAWVCQWQSPTVACWRSLTFVRR